MIAIGPAVHQDDGEGVDALGPDSRQFGSRLRFVERLDDRPIGTDALVDLDHAFVKHGRQDDVARENLGPRLVTDAQRVAEPARDRQRQPVPLALQQRIGRDRRPHPHGFDLATLGG